MIKLWSMSWKIGKKKINVKSKGSSSKITFDISKTCIILNATYLFKVSLRINQLRKNILMVTKAIRMFFFLNLDSKAFYFKKINK